MKQSVTKCRRINLLKSRWRLKWPYAITRLTAHLCLILIVIYKLRKVWSNMTPNALTQYILRAGVIKQHKLNQILSWYDVILLLLGRFGFLQGKRSQGSVFCHPHIKSTILQSTSKFSINLGLITVKKSKVIKSYKPLIISTKLDPP